MPVVNDDELRNLIEGQESRNTIYNQKMKRNLPVALLKWSLIGILFRHFYTKGITGEKHYICADGSVFKFTTWLINTKTN